MNRPVAKGLCQRRERSFLCGDGRLVAMSQGNMGCPHEEGEDFPHGEDCPFVPSGRGSKAATGGTDTMAKERPRATAAVRTGPRSSWSELRAAGTPGQTG